MRGYAPMCGDLRGCGHWDEASAQTARGSTGDTARAMSQENVDAVRAVHEEWGKGNLRVGLELHDPDILFLPLRHLPDAGRYLGPEGISDFMHRWLKPWTDITVSADEFIEAGDSVVVANRQRGVGTDSGAPTELRYFEVWTFRGGVVIRREQFRDRAEALEAVGLSE